ncbi:hypothetical protein L6164_022279 [Bauhinia variegata]|uniref:Uncharacterized protein n=1 Tax=Bauhinia variegata TaxID=167791 RepID=A0ACB9MEP3_BAUVA|nr:hypothetical protein L6164_022279 [Bauhinia variegata]
MSWQKYEPHYDCFLDEYNNKIGSQRIVTLVYLLDVEGGETIFPAAKTNLVPYHAGTNYLNAVERVFL